MPDYDYDLALENGSFVVHARVIDPSVRRITGAAPAFPSEFTTRVPLPDPVMGFRHRYRDKTLDVVLPKVGGASLSAALVLRPMRRDDLPAVLEIERRAFAQPWSRAFFEKELSTPFAQLTVADRPESPAAPCSSATAAAGASRTRCTC